MNPAEKPAEAFAVPPPYVLDVSPTQTVFDLPAACAACETESAWLAEWRNRSSVAGVEKDEAGSPCGLDEPGP